MRKCVLERVIVVKADDDAQSIVNLAILSDTLLEEEITTLIETEAPTPFGSALYAALADTPAQVGIRLQQPEAGVRRQPASVGAPSQRFRQRSLVRLAALPSTSRRPPYS